MLTVSVILVFLQAAQGSHYSDPGKLSKAFGELTDSGHGSKHTFLIEKETTNPSIRQLSSTAPKSPSSFDEYIYNTFTRDNLTESPPKLNRSFSNSSGLKQSIRASSDDTISYVDSGSDSDSEMSHPATIVKPHPEMTAASSSSSSVSEKTCRVKDINRAIWFTQLRHSSSRRVKSNETVDRMIQKFAWLGQCFQPDAQGENTVLRTRMYGAKMSNDYMVFSDLLKTNKYVTGMATLKSRGFFDIEKLVAVEESAGNTLSIVLDVKQIMFHSFGNPPLAAVLLRVKDGQYESVMTSGDNMSVEKTLKSKDVIVVGLCETVWEGLSFPADSSLEKIVTNVAERFNHGVAVAAIIR